MITLPRGFHTVQRPLSVPSSCGIILQLHRQVAYETYKLPFSPL